MADMGTNSRLSQPIFPISYIPSSKLTGPTSLNGTVTLTSHPINNMTSNTINFSSSSSTSLSSNNGICCLIENGIKCSRNAGNASYSKRIEKQLAQRKLHLNVDPRSSHSYICEYHKKIIQSIRTKRKRKDEDGILDDDGNDFNGANDSSNEMPHSLSNNSFGSKYNHDIIDFNTLQVATLRKYKRFFRLSIKHGVSKSQLAEEIQRHFRTLAVNEKDVISKFMYNIKNKTDLNNSKD